MIQLASKAGGFWWSDTEQTSPECKNVVFLNNCPETHNSSTQTAEAASSQRSSREAQVHRGFRSQVQTHQRKAARFFKVWRKFQVPVQPQGGQFDAWC